MDYTVLVIDDDEPIHLMTKKLLGDEYNLIHARDAQEAIDIISEEPINLVLSDIHMPGMSGLEFLESVMNDADKREIPVLIMTNLPTVEKEKKALDLGAADFIEKTQFNEDKEEILEQVRMKLVTSVNIPDLSSDLAINKKKFVSQLMSEALSGDFVNTAKKLCTILRKRFEIDHTSIWTISNGEPSMISTVGTQLPENFGAKDLKNEQTYQQLLEKREPYLSNHVFNKEVGILPEFSKENDLPAEIGIPVFALNEKKLLMNNMQIPDDADLFGFLLLKRNKLFSTKEYEMISRLLTQSGTILWRLYKAI